MTTPPSTEAEIEARLTGQYVKLYPYVRGFWPPETLFTLWRIIQAEGALPQVFYGRPSPAVSPWPTTGDLVEFVRFFSPIAGEQARVLLLVQALRTDQPAGLVWFDDIQGHHRASASIFYRRRYWGDPAREASRLALRYAFDVMDVASVWGYTPWRIARRHAEACGMQCIATLPGYLCENGQTLDYHILRLTRQQWEASPRG